MGHEFWKLLPCETDRVSTHRNMLATNSPLLSKLFPVAMKTSVEPPTSRRWPVFLLTLAAIGQQAIFGSRAAQAQPARLAPVAVAAVIEREVATGQSFVGTVEPVRKSIVGSAVGGRVIEFPVNEGDRVEAGQTLAQLLTETVELELAVAQAELELRKQELAELENGSRAEEKEQAIARMKAAEASIQYLRARRRRAQELFQQGRTVTREELEEQVAASDRAEHNYLEAKATHELVMNGPRAEKIAQARARVAMQQATVDRLTSQVRKHTMISRFAGYVVAEHTEVGQWVSAGDPVAEVVALDEVDVEAFVLENHVPHIRVGTMVRVEITALPETIFTGNIVSVVPRGDNRSRTFPVKVRVRNVISTESADPLIKAGMMARVTLPTGPRAKALLVPKDAIVLGGPSPMVFVVDRKEQDATKGAVRPVTVNLGMAYEDRIQILGEIQAGQLVVVQGNERLRPGQAVEIVETAREDLAASP